MPLSGRGMLKAPLGVKAAWKTHCLLDHRILESCSVPQPEERISGVHQVTLTLPNGVEESGIHNSRRTFFSI